MRYMNFKKMFFWKNHHKHINYKIDRLGEDIETIKDILEKARIAKFLKVIDYKRGMSLTDDRPNPISLENFEKRIGALEDKNNK